MVDVKKVNLYVSGALGNWKTSEIPTSPEFPNILYSNGSTQKGAVRFYDLTPDPFQANVSSILDPFNIFIKDVDIPTPLGTSTVSRIQIPFSRLYEFEIQITPQNGRVSSTGIGATDLAFKLSLDIMLYSEFHLSYNGTLAGRFSTNATYSDGFYLYGATPNAYAKFQKYLYAGDYLEIEFYYTLKPNRDAVDSPFATIILKELEDI